MCENEFWPTFSFLCVILFNSDKEEKKMQILGLDSWIYKKKNMKEKTEMARKCWDLFYLILKHTDTCTKCSVRNAVSHINV